MCTAPGIIIRWIEYIIGSVYLAAAVSQKAVCSTPAVLLLEICEGPLSASGKFVSVVRKCSAYQHSAYNFMESDPHTPPFEDS